MRVLRFHRTAASQFRQAKAAFWDMDLTIGGLPREVLVHWIHRYQRYRGLRPFKDDVEAFSVFRCHDPFRFLELTGISDTEWYTGFNKFFPLDSRIRAFQAYEGIAELIATLAQKGKQQHVLTNTSYRIARPQLAKAGLSHLPVLALIGPPELPRKPDPHGLQLLLEQYGLQPSEAVFVGDSSGDSQMAEAAGVPFIWRRNLHHRCAVSARIARARITSYPAVTHNLRNGASR